MSERVDLFGQPSGPAQLSLFGSDEGRLKAPQQTFTPDPDSVRRRLAGLLARVRHAAEMPWSERDARMWQTVFPQMASWLPEREANQLRLEFAQEIERLRAA